MTLSSGLAPLDQFLSERNNASLSERHAVLAVGSNGCPGRLAEKFGTESGTAIPVLLGTIENVSVVYSRQLVSYGALPATFINQLGAISRLSITLLTQEQLEQMDATEQVGEMYYRIPLSSGFLVDNGLKLEDVTAYLDPKILSYRGRPVYVKMFAHGESQGEVMDEREVLSVVFDRAGVMAGESIERRHHELLVNESIRQRLTQFLESNMSELQVDEEGSLVKGTEKKGSSS